MVEEKIPRMVEDSVNHFRRGVSAPTPFEWQEGSLSSAGSLPMIMIQKFHEVDLRPEAFPLRAQRGVMTVVTGAAFVLLLEYSQLKKIEDWQDFLCTAHHNLFGGNLKTFVYEGDALYVPAGYVPVVVGLPQTVNRNAIYLPGDVDKAVENETRASWVFTPVFDPTADCDRSVELSQWLAKQFNAGHQYLSNATKKDEAVEQEKVSLETRMTEEE